MVSFKLLGFENLRNHPYTHKQRRSRAGRKNNQKEQKDKTNSYGNINTENLMFRNYNQKTKICSVTTHDNKKNEATVQQSDNSNVGKGIL